MYGSHGTQLLSILDLNASYIHRYSTLSYKHKNNMRFRVQVYDPRLRLIRYVMSFIDLTTSYSYALKYHTSINNKRFTVQLRDLGLRLVELVLDYKIKIKIVGEFNALKMKVTSRKSGGFESSLG